MFNRATPLSRFGPLLLGLLLLIPGTVEAQRFKWWQDEGVVRQVGLTAKQAKKIDDIFKGSMPDLVKAKQELDRLERDLIPFVDSATDDSELRERVDRVETARAELNKRRSLMLLRMRRVLSVEQRVKLESLQQDRDRRRAHDTPKRSY
jgi:Spy/CpxP family protein refolding chaperone